MYDIMPARRPVTSKAAARVKSMFEDEADPGVTEMADLMREYLAAIPSMAGDVIPNVQGLVTVRGLAQDVIDGSGYAADVVDLARQVVDEANAALAGIRAGVDADTWDEMMMDAVGWDE